MQGRALYALFVLQEKLNRERVYKHALLQLLKVVFSTTLQEGVIYEMSKRSLIITHIGAPIAMTTFWFFNFLSSCFPKEIKPVILPAVLTQWILPIFVLAALGLKIPEIMLVISSLYQQIRKYERDSEKVAMGIAKVTNELIKWLPKGVDEQSQSVRLSAK